MLLNSLTGYEPKQEIVDTPELGEDAQVIIREMSGKRSRAYFEYLQSLGKGESFSTMVYVIFSLVTEDGAQMHTLEDLELLEDNLPISVQSRLIKKAMELNGAEPTTPHKKKDK